MNLIYARGRIASLVSLFLVLSLLVSGCAALGTGGTRLRVTNAGSVPIENLVVLFPEEKVEFGDVPAGTTTEYKTVPGGVYRYAAYSYDFEGTNIGQPVLDWVGEEPIEGDAFTYVIDLDPSREPMFRIQLQGVQQDE